MPTLVTLYLPLLAPSSLLILFLQLIGIVINYGTLVLVSQRGLFNQ